MGEVLDVALACQELVVAAEEEMAEMALEEAVVAPAEVGAAAVDEPKVSKKKS